jgi:hypothetical protein
VDGSPLNVEARTLALLTIGMSLPLLFSFQLNAPPAFLSGLPFILIWTWAVVSALTVPVLAALEVAALFCPHRGRDQVALPLHATALVVAIVAEVVFLSARSNGG